MNLPANLAIKSIDFYQKELSHKKKFHCAHGALHKGYTCSEYSKQQIEKAGLLVGIKKTLFRLRECYLASKTIKAYSVNDEMKNQDPKVESCAKIQLAADTACCFLTFWPG